jgi:hypothetical protein
LFPACGTTSSTSAAIQFRFPKSSFPSAQRSLSRTWRLWHRHQQHSSSLPVKAILRTSHLLRDILLWLLLHYNGTLVVNVGGQIIYRADLGNPYRELEVHVASACSESSDCGATGKESYEILRHISGKFEEFLSGSSFSGFTDLPPRPGIRQKLYDVPRTYHSDSATRNKGL